MRIHEIFSLEPIDHHSHRGNDVRQSRGAEHQWRQDIEKKDLYNLVTASGKTVKSGVTKAEAEKLRSRPDVKAKFGFLAIEKQ